MAGTLSPHRSRWLWLVSLALAIGGGVWLRLDQLGSQLLLDDEWHAVYRVVHDTPAAVFLDFGHSDSSIPLTLLYLFESRVFGLSEVGMRWPLVAAGIATLVLFPGYRARRVPALCRAPRRRGACALCCVRYARSVAASGRRSIRRLTLRSAGVGIAAEPVRRDAKDRAPAARHSDARGGRADDGAAFAAAARAPGVDKPQERHRSAAHRYADRRLLCLVRHGLDDRPADFRRVRYRWRFGRVAAPARGGIDACRARSGRAHDRRDAPGLDPKPAHFRPLPPADSPLTAALDRVRRGKGRPGRERCNRGATPGSSTRRRQRRGSGGDTALCAGGDHTALARCNASEWQQPARGLSVRFPPGT